MSTGNKSFTPKEIKDLWQTPPEIFKSMKKEFDFNCDVAANFSNTFLPHNHLGEQYSGEFKDALNCDWDTVNWCNPPYSDIRPWVEMAETQCVEYGRTTVMLVPADTSVKWFKRAIETCNEARFISGRLSFINAETQKPVNGNNKGSVLLIWRAYCKTPCVMSLVDRDELMEG